ncbi:hypothetical protein L2E82_13652 [Cichorium intybus]|uniref:Uncharacterized protein n=1 Tax=Cichorium intybus TaxID=13427 RepID=A0ACB9EX75_CICIN|nr:hypothetical protein L2E82_13652 [Cichorium intybus]
MNRCCLLPSSLKCKKEKEKKTSCRLPSEFVPASVLDKKNARNVKAMLDLDKIENQIDQAMIDSDKTEKKGELRANAILAVSIVACIDGAAEKDVPLYKQIVELSGRGINVLRVHAFTLISGGKHVGNILAI